MDYDVLIGYKMKEDFRWNTQDREISFEKENVKEFIFDKFEGLQPSDVLKLDLFTDTFQVFCPELQLATLKNSYFKIPFFSEYLSQWFHRKFWN